MGKLCIGTFQRVLIRTLVDLGSRHNRCKVQEIVSKVLQSITDPGDAGIRPEPVTPDPSVTGDARDASGTIGARIS